MAADAPSTEAPPAGTTAPPPAGTSPAPAATAFTQAPPSTPAPSPADGPEPLSLEEARKLRSEANSLRKRLKELEDANTQRAEAELTEQQKLAKRAERAEQEAATLKAQVAALGFRTAVLETAQPMGFVDLDAVVKLLDPSEVQRGDDGAPNSASLKAALGRLKEARPWLSTPAAAQNGTTQAPQITQTRALPGTPQAGRAAPPDAEAQAEARLLATGQYRRL